MNEALQRLYQSIILEHHARPRNLGPLDSPTHQASRDNPLCGDRITLRLRCREDRIEQVRFEGDGCALSIASASLLTTSIETRGVDHAHLLDAALRRLLSRAAEPAQGDRDRLGELVALEGARLFPSRIPCALLPWDALAQALFPASPK